MLEAIDNIEEFCAGRDFATFSADKILKYAVFFNVAVIGEAAYKLTKEFTAAHHDVPWRDIINMRHVIIHGYYQIDAETLWHTVRYDLAPLRKAILRYLSEPE